MATFPCVSILSSDADTGRLPGVASAGRIAALGALAAVVAVICRGGRQATRFLTQRRTGAACHAPRAFSDPAPSNRSELQTVQQLKQSCPLHLSVPAFAPSPTAVPGLNRLPADALLQLSQASVCLLHLDRLITPALAASLLKKLPRSTRFVLQSRACDRNLVRHFPPADRNRVTIVAAPARVTALHVTVSIADAMGGKQDCLTVPVPADCDVWMWAFMFSGELALHLSRQYSLPQAVAASAGSGDRSACSVSALA